MDKPSNKYSVLCICLAIALTTLVVYWQLRDNDFVNFDDPGYISQNEHVKAGLTWEGIVWAFSQSHAFNWHPLTWISHMLDCELYSLNAGGHHFTNLLFHIVNALLLFLLLNRMTKNLWASAFVAAAFALHPLHTESVAWASERKDVLSTFFWILTTWAYVWYVERRGIARYILVMLFFVLGLLSKQMLVTLPFVLLLLDYWPLKRFGFEERSSMRGVRPVVSVTIRQSILEKVPLFILSVAASIIVFSVQQGTVVMKSILEYSLAYRLANAVVAYTLYIGKMFWPIHLAIIYPHQGDKLPAWQIAGAILLMLCITTAVIYKLRRRPYLGVGWFWYLGTLVPVIGLVQVGNQALADRYTYVPLTGLFIIVAWGMSDMLGRLRYRKVVLSLLGIISLAVLGVLSSRQVRHWRNGITLYEHATKVVANNWLAHNMLGRLFASQGNFEKAIEEYNKALKIEPDNALPNTNLGTALAQQGRLDLKPA